MPYDTTALHHHLPQTNSINSPGPTTSNTNSLDLDSELITASSRMRLVEMLKQSCLFGPMQSILNHALHNGTFENALNCSVSKSALEKIPFGLVPTPEGVYKSRDTDASIALDLDEYLLSKLDGDAGEETISESIAASLEVCRRESQELLEKLDDLLIEIESLRPLTPDERYCRAFSLKAPFKVFESELYNSSRTALENKKRRKNLPDKALNLMRNWFYKHLEHPYPTSTEKKEFVMQGGVTLQQVEYWFTNARARVFKKDSRKQGN